ncbi:Ribosomal RNA small subunit methyltransferase B [Chlamydiales bacterium STE3]|nr:Ribosomal RNA small subunit methyltransferase B [Chlamydiales bacterium STE3]
MNVISPMKIPFREYHIVELLKAFERKSLPLDLFLSDYFREHKSIGSKDRQFIADTVYGLVRWKNLLGYLTQSSEWVKWLECYLNERFCQAIEDTSIPLHIRHGFPQELFDLLVNSHGESATCQICIDSNQAAPTHIRINPLKISRDALLEKWQHLYEVAPTAYSPYGITFLKKINFYALDEFKAGLFEVQDENSQRLGELIDVKPGDLVLDFCSGSGGKTLAFAHKLEGKGQIYLHDIRPFILQMAKKRLKRAGIQNAQTILAEDPKLQKIKKKMNRVLVDAPCSGTGTLRRNPDMKWRFSETILKNLIGEQRNIFEKALSYLAPDGKIIYATCSILDEENEKQVEHFIKTYQLELVQPYFKTLPKPNEGDGFFGAVLKKTKLNK